ncbi:unnamed protein product [Bemisia tabaci]|uniref:ABC-type glutathione-S-conjugate transporter n=1 Tax=Bemisia tabaci TaxID=7038 RepID=A0A9P0ADT3_BEMTA|nr:unnamed protein product [Bemisia tabaci]
MDHYFCNSPLWDLNVTWNTSDPNFTPCFQATILSWVPCLFLWFFAPFSVRSLMKRQTWTVPWAWLNTAKFLLTLLLVFLSLVDLFYSVISYFDGRPFYLVDFITPLLKTVTFALAASLLILYKLRGVPSSALLFLFWFLSVICGAPRYKYELDRAYRQNLGEAVVPFVSYMVYYAIVLGLFILNFFADLLPISPSYSPKEKSSPYSQASFPSLVTFSWFDPLAWKGYRRPIVLEDLWSLAEDDSVKKIAPKFNKHCRKRSNKNPQSRNVKEGTTRTANGIELKPYSDKVASKEVYPSIWFPLIKTFWPSVLFGFSLKLCNDILIFVSPHILKSLISFMGSEEEVWHGYFYAGGLFIAASFQTLFLAHYFNRMRITGLRIRVALTSAIYRKALNISNASRKESTVGEIVNLMSVDAQRFMELMPHLSLLWSAPLQISLAVFFLWEILGPSVLGGLVVMILVILINIPIARKSDALTMKQMRYKDERIKLMNEILSGIKVLKLYAWETSFEKHIQKIRMKEVNTLKQLAILGSTTAFIWSCAPLLVALTTFGVYLFIDDEHSLDAEKTFATVALFNILKFPLVMLPNMISNLVQTMVSVRRLNKFMNSDELDPNCVTHSASEKEPLVIEKGNFGWGTSVPVLHDIDIKIFDKSLVAVVGTVGCGKSSLLAAFLGEMDLISGRVNTKGSIAYVTQQAWIQNATLRENILFGKEYDYKTYNKVIKACALRSDFALLPGGDQTEIGEKGINLSGGQKQRVSLARAVYSDADVYFLDDPLSAVDSHVGKHIFENVIGPQGLLKNKTRVLVTHGLTYLPDVDEIYVLKNGMISEKGTYKQLIDKKGAFAEFIQTHMLESENDDKPAEGTQDISRPSSPLVYQRVQDRSRPSSPALLRKRSHSASERGSTLSLRQFSYEEGSNFVEQDDDRRNKIIDEEIAMTGNIKWSVFSHYMRAMGWLFVFLAFAFTLLFQVCAVGSNLWLSIWTSRNNTLPDGSQDPEERNWFLEVYAILGLSAGLCAIVADLAPRIGCVKASRALHGYLLHGILRAPLTFTDTTPIGRILSRFSKDVDTMDNKLPMEISDTLYCVMEVIGVLFIITYATPPFLWCIVPLVILYYILQRFYTATSRQLQRLESISRSPIFSHFSETVAGAQVIRAYGAVNRFIQEYEKRMDANQICFHPTVISIRWLSVRLETIGNLIIFCAAFFAVLARGSLSAGLVGLSVSYALQVTGALNWFVRMASSVETDVVAIERVKEYTEIQEEAKWDVPETLPPAKWPQKGNIVFENFKVRYRSELDLVLKGLNFSVNEREKVGIVGRTGAGKSSLTLALFRIIEAAEGAIYIDGIDISTLGLHTLRSRLTVIPQDPVLFSGSLRMNLDPLGVYSDTKIWHALELSHLKEFVKSQAAGLQHEIAEGGENLSVGQRQLICLARALLRKTKVLILDEATAAVDVETDDLIQTTIRQEFSDCTILTIAHRLNTIMDSDRVLVLDHGLIMEYDSPLNLLKNPASLFHSLVKDAGLDVETILSTQSMNGRQLVV